MMKILNNPLIMALLLIVLIVASCLVLNVAAGSTMSRVDWKRETYRVQSGDSLWAISRDYCPDNVDRQEWINEIQEINGLTSSFIYPGQKITVLVPVE